MERIDPADLDRVIEEAVARAHHRAEAKDGAAPGLAAHLLAFFRRPDTATYARRGLHEDRAYLAVWCEDLEPLEPTGDAEPGHGHALGHGHLPEGERVRWIAAADEATAVEVELATTHEPVPVSIGSWQLV